MRAGFTLIELLVVVAIISVLAAILLPVLSSARERARRIACVSNLRQMYLSYQLYADDSDDYFPGIVGLGQNKMADAYYSAAYMSYGWQFSTNNALPLYMDKRVTLCPSVGNSDAQAEWQRTSQFAWGFTDYSLKAGYGSNHDGTTADGLYSNPACTWAERGILNYRFAHRADGFWFNYRREQSQPRAGMKAQSTDSIMFMDRQRPPVASSQDGTIYASESNHKNGSPLGGAAGANIVQANGVVRWMNLASVWGKADWSDNYYSTSGYAEGAYPQYVDDEIAGHW